MLRRGNVIMNIFQVEDQVVDIFTISLGKDHLHTHIETKLQRRRYQSVQRNWWLIKIGTWSLFRKAIENISCYECLKIHIHVQKESRLKDVEKTLWHLKKTEDLVLLCPLINFLIWRNMWYLLCWLSIWWKEYFRSDSW